MILNVKNEYGNEYLEINDLSNPDKLFNDILSILCNSKNEFKDNTICTHQINLCDKEFDFDNYMQLFPINKKGIYNREIIYNRLYKLRDYILTWLNVYGKELSKYKLPVNVVNHKCSTIINLDDYTSDLILKKDIVDIMISNTQTICNSNYFTIGSKNILFNSFVKGLDIIQYNTGRSEFPHYTRYELQNNLNKHWEHIKTRLELHFKYITNK